MSVPMTLTDLELEDTEGQNFLEDFHNYSKMDNQNLEWHNMVQ